MIIKARFPEPENEFLRDYNRSLFKHFQKLNIHIARSDEDEFFISVVHVEKPEDMSKVRRYKEMGTNTIAILHTLNGIDFMEAVWEERYVDRFVVHHRFFSEIISREIYDSTRAIFYPFPVRNTGFDERSGDNILIPEDYQDEKVVKHISENHEVIFVGNEDELPQPGDIKAVLLPYMGEDFETRFSLYRLITLQRPAILPRIPVFEEFAFRELTPEILYSPGDFERVERIIRWLGENRIRTYFTYVIRGYVMSYTFHRFARVLKKIMIDIIPEEYLSLYVI